MSSHRGTLGSDAIRQPAFGLGAFGFGGCFGGSPGEGIPPALRDPRLVFRRRAFSGARGGLGGFLGSIGLGAFDAFGLGGAFVGFALSISAPVVGVPLAPALGLSAHEVRGPVGEAGSGIERPKLDLQNYPREPLR